MSPNRLLSHSLVLFCTVLGGCAIDGSCLPERKVLEGMLAAEGYRTRLTEQDNPEISLRWRRVQRLIYVAQKPWPQVEVLCDPHDPTKVLGLQTAMFTEPAALPSRVESSTCPATADPQSEQTARQRFHNQAMKNLIFRLSGLNPMKVPLHDPRIIPMPFVQLERGSQVGKGLRLEVEYRGSIDTRGRYDIFLCDDRW